MSVFAGFWVDGAVRKPEQRHCDSEDTVIARWKQKGDREQTLGVSNEFDICHRYFPNWDQVYWLDTTPRESLTPEELLSVLKVIWPKCKSVFDPGNDADVGWQVQRDETEEYTPIEWNGIGIYPPPAEPGWIRITKENVSQYLFRDCRTQRNDITYAGRIVGWCLEDDCCLVESDYQTEEPILKWDVVEVIQCS